MSPIKKTRTIFQLPHKGTWFENIATRSNGTILATRLDASQLWAIDPTTGKGNAVVSFPTEGPGPHYHSLSGIVEIRQDIFVIGVGTYVLGPADGSTPGSSVPGSWIFCVVDLTDPHGIASVRPSVAIPEAGFINGLTMWDDHTVLAADSERGVVYKVDVDADTYTVALEDETMTPPEDATTKVGISGIRLYGRDLYFTNSTRQSLYRVPVDDAAKAMGPVDTVAAGLWLDDFVVDVSDENGTMYICGNQGNVVYQMTQPGQPVVIAGDSESLELAGATACALGRGENDKRVLYVVTAGGLAMPVQGKLTEPAKVAAIDLDG